MDCQFGTKCAMLAASKYGMIDGGSACIPTYNEQQIEFWPKTLFLNIPTDMLFLERGRIEIPDKSNVRIVSGMNPGCMGVWDRSAIIIAETSVPLFKRDKHDFYIPGEDVESTKNTQPYSSGRISTSISATSSILVSKRFSRRCAFATKLWLFHSRELAILAVWSPNPWCVWIFSLLGAETS